MPSLAALRYRNVLGLHGGPIESIESGPLDMRGRRMVQANARLTPGLVRRRPPGLYSDADGTGTHPVAGIARHIAVSEALERWAFHAVVRSERAAEFGFDVDPSSNGMSAFPGLFRREARRRAVLEGIERFCLVGWWEGMLPGRPVATDWPGVSAVAIEGPFGGVTAVVHARTGLGGHAYGHAAEESIGAACERAIVELARHECVLRSWHLGFLAGARRLPASVFERRCLFFSTDEGHQLFRSRVGRGARGPAPRAQVACDRDIPGPWSEYATVWRFVLTPPSRAFLGDDERCFFW